MSESLLEIAGLTAGYGKASAVRNLDLAIGKGEVLALLGANGAGKTTTLRAVSGAIGTMAGTVRLDGEDITNRPAQWIARRGLVHMSDRRGIFHGLTVAEHFRVGPRGEQLDAAAAYELFPALGKLRNRRAGLLSGGEQQMLGLGRSLARRPRVLLLDEFSLGLAPVIVQQLLPVVRRYATEHDAGVLLVEQHVELALRIADRGAVMTHGELLFVRSAKELLNDRTLIEASYLGEPGDAEHSPDNQLNKNGAANVS
jgi:ABC-type branched-subunit amino acid transport system ATPase component